MDATELDLVHKAIASGIVGCVEWDERAAERLKKEFAKHRLTLEGVRRRLIDHVRNGGDVLPIKEKREEWKDLGEYWYKVILPFPSLFKQGLFVEIVLHDSDPELPEVLMVNAHE